MPRARKVLLPRDYFRGVLNEPKPVKAGREDAVVYANRVAAWEARRFEAAKALAPYEHPKLESVAHTGASGGPIKVAVRVAFIRPKAAA